MHWLFRFSAGVALTVAGSAMADHDVVRRPPTHRPAVSPSKAPGPGGPKHLSAVLTGFGVSDVYAARINHLIDKAKNQLQPGELQEAVHRFVAFVAPEQQGRLLQMASAGNVQDPATKEFFSWVRAEMSGRRAATAIASGAAPSEVRRAFIPQHPFKMPKGGSRQLCYEQCNSADYRVGPVQRRLACLSACDQAN